MILLLSMLHGPELSGAEMEDEGQPVRLFPEEEALVQKSVPKRQREFALGRACARAALARLGRPDGAIGRGANGAPLWPDGIVGSITHTQGYAASLVGLSRFYAGIGIDAERIGRVSPDLWPRLFDPSEMDHLGSLDAATQAVTATLFFCAKEACFKAWGGTLNFQEIHITPGAGSFAAVRAGEQLQGRYAMGGDLLLTATWRARG